MIFPALIFFAGAYFIYRGFGKLSACYLSGKVKTKARSNDPRGNPCIYSRVEISYYVGGNTEWKQFYSKEQRQPFYLGSLLVDPGLTDIRLKPTKEEGVIDRQRGILEKIANRALNPLGAPTGVPKSPLGAETTKMLSRMPITKHAKKPLRIIEYALRPGDAIYIAYSSDAGKPFLLTDVSEADARSIVREKFLFTISCGFALLVFSAILLFVLLF